MSNYLKVDITRLKRSIGGHKGKLPKRGWDFPIEKIVFHKGEKVLRRQLINQTDDLIDLLSTKLSHELREFKQFKKIRPVEVRVAHAKGVSKVYTDLIRAHMDLVSHYESFYFHYSNLKNPYDKMIKSQGSNKISDELKEMSNRSTLFTERIPNIIDRFNTQIDDNMIQVQLLMDKRNNWEEANL